MTISLRKPSAVLFDWDNTLVDNWDCIGQALNHTLQTMGHPIYSPDELNQKMRQSSREHFSSVFGESRVEEARSIFYTHLKNKHIESLKVIEGALQLLELFSEVNIPMGVVSTKNGDMLRKEMDHLGWNHYFGSSVVGAGDAKHDKPHQASFDHAIQGIMAQDILSYKDVWYVGDTETDMTLAKTVGCVPIFIETKRMHYLLDIIHKDVTILSFKGLTDFYQSSVTLLSS